MKKMKDYTYHKGLEMRIYPSYKQKEIIKVNGGAARKIYNTLVAVHNEMYGLRKYAPYCPVYRERLEYLKDLYSNVHGLKFGVIFLNMDKRIDSDMIYNEYMHYQNAWKQFKKIPEAKKPTFHKYYYEYSYSTSNHYTKKSVDGLYDGSIRFEDKNHIVLPKIGKIRCKGSPKIMKALFEMQSNVRIGSAHIRMTAEGKFFASITLASDEPFHKPYQKTGRSGGIDLNLTNLFTTSDNFVAENAKFLKKTQGELAKVQKQLSRKYEAAKRDKAKLRDRKKYQEARQKVAKIHAKIARQRLAYQRYLADILVTIYDLIVAEDLKVKNLLKNHKLARAISDVAWRQLLTTIDWACKKRGKTLLLIDPRNTTQRCSNCGEVMKGENKIELGVEEWDCPYCGTHHIRDYNAAINILNTGLEQLALQNN